MTPDIILLWITVALAIAAMVIYAAGAIRTIRTKKDEKEQEVPEVNDED